MGVKKNDGMKYQAESYDGKPVEGYEVRRYGVNIFLVLQNDKQGYREIRIKEETLEEVEENE